VWVSLIWMYWTEVRRTDIMHHTLLDAAGAVQGRY